MGGETYHFDAANTSPTKFPEYYDGKNFSYEFGRGWIRLFTTGRAGRARVDRAVHGLVRLQAADQRPVRPGRLVLRPRLRHRQLQRRRELGRLPDRLRPGHAQPDGGRDRRQDHRPRAAHRELLRRGLRRPRRHARHLRLGPRRRRRDRLDGREADLHLRAGRPLHGHARGHRRRRPDRQRLGEHRRGQHGADGHAHRPAARRDVRVRRHHHLLDLRHRRRGRRDRLRPRAARHRARPQRAHPRRPEPDRLHGHDHDPGRLGGQDPAHLLPDVRQLHGRRRLAARARAHRPRRRPPRVEEPAGGVLRRPERHPERGATAAPPAASASATSRPATGCASTTST